MIKFPEQDSEVLIAINSQGLYVIDPVNVVGHGLQIIIWMVISNNGRIAGEYI